MLAKPDILQWLRESDPDRLESLWQDADRTRRENVGDAVHLRGLIEISNHCRRMCHYCGVRAANTSVTRYRMTAGEILAAAREAEGYGYGTVVMQAGEDPGLSADFIADIVHTIKARTGLAVTLSLGERSDDDLALWRHAGADRYLLRFETSNCELYERIHPSLPGTPSDRFAILRRLKELGYEVGSGVMVGIPGQTYDDLADDILWFAELDLDMIGIGPFIVHPATPLGQADDDRMSQPDQVPNDEAIVYKVLALTRLVCPAANIPSTTALATINADQGRELGLARGANIIMPNVTPARYRALYEIYPAKAGSKEAGDPYHDGIKARIRAAGRTIGSGRGDSPNIGRRASVHDSDVRHMK